jgi:putative oxidoreductase
MNFFSKTLLRFVARILFAALFILSGVSKLTDPAATQAYMVAKGLPMVPTLMYISAFIEIVGGLFILLGFWTRTAALFLFGFLVIVTLKMHNFWDLAGAERQAQLIEFMKNLGVLGGLLYIMSAAPGKWAICNDECCGTKSKT